MPQNTRDKPAGIEKVSNNHQSIFFCLIVNLLSTKPATIKQMIKCGQCEKDEAKLVTEIF